MIAELGEEVYRHPTQDIVAIQGEDRIRIMTEDGECEFGDLHENATKDEIQFAVSWLQTGLRIGRRDGEIHAKYEIRRKWKDLTNALGLKSA